MISTKLGLLGLCAAVVGMISVSSGAAQGATLSWLILDEKKVVATELKAELSTAFDSQHLVLHVKIDGMTGAITCRIMSLSLVSLELKGKLNDGGRATFIECGVYKKVPLSEPFPCTVKSPGAPVGRIETGELKGELVLHTLASGGQQVLAKVQSKAGLEGNLATIRFEGAGCPLPESIVLHGTLYLKDFHNQATVHKAEHLVEQGPLTSLYLGGHSADQLAITKILGSAWIRLAAGDHADLEWSAMDV
jgi:hypothetical protein